MATPHTPRVEKAPRSNGISAAPKPARGTGCPLRVGTAPVEPTAGAKGAEPGKTAGAPYRGPREERDPAPVMKIAHTGGVPR